MNQRILRTAAATLCLAAGGAWADKPANIGNTTWTVQVNRDVEQLVITAQGGPGAPGAAVCRGIVGTIGRASIHGWYCPSTGRIHFEHKNMDSGITVRSFTGSLADEVTGQPNHMAGTMMIVAHAFGDLGEYNFSGTN